MAVVLKDKNGNYLTRPITHPASNDQVKAQLKSIIDEGSVDLNDMFDELKEIDELKHVVYGDELLPNPTFDWYIGRIDDNSGKDVDDPQNMRITSRMMYAYSDIIITFSNTTKYRYIIFYYDKDGNYIAKDDGYRMSPTASILRGCNFKIVVREVNYALWDADKIDSFISTINARYDRVVGLSERISNIEAVDYDGIEAQILDSKNKISGIESAIKNITTGETNTNILIQQNDVMFSSIERDAINWENGQNISYGGNNYVRSSDYYYVNAEMSGVIIYTAKSTSRVSLYKYSKIGSNYVFVNSSRWLFNAEYYEVDPGYYYRMLAYDGTYIDPEDVNVVLTNSLMSEVISKLMSSSDREGDMIDESLSNDEIIEYNKTASSIISAIDNNPNSAVICFPTDLHLIISADLQTCLGYNPYLKKQMTMYNKISDLVNIDLTVYGGDYLCNSKETNKASAIGSLKTLKYLIERTNKNVPNVVVKGNHDDNTMYLDYKNGYVNDIERWDSLLCVDKDRTNRNADFVEKGYGYYDIKNKKIRVFFINSVDLPTKLNESNNSLEFSAQNDSGLSNEQLNYIAEHLMFNESGWQVVLFSHHTPPVISTKHGGSNLVSILEAFKNKRSVSIHTTPSNTDDYKVSYDIDYDYSNNKSNEIIAFISGHSHYDDIIETNGIKYITLCANSGGYGSYYYATDKAGRYVNYIVINRKTRKITFIKDGTDADSMKNKGSTTISNYTGGDFVVSY